MKVAVIGDGGWGTALAMVLDHKGHDVTVWGPRHEPIQSIEKRCENIHFLPGVPLSNRIKWTTHPGKAAKHAQLVVVVVPSRFYKATLEMFAPFISNETLVVSATKGIDESSYETMSVCAERILGQAVAVLSGPSHAEEVATQIPCAVTIAAEDLTLAHAVQEAFMSDPFRIYTHTDVLGVELGGTLKNVIAIAAGISDGLGFGDNTKAALMTRGLAEMTRLGVALGAEADTFRGLSGLGDLMVTCMSKHSRNRGVGERLGRGSSIEDILSDMKMVAEGVWNCKAVCELAQEKEVAMPIAEQVNAVVHQGVNPRDAMLSLMGRSPKSEHE